jgi:peptide/nickel transport system ATP-binding protein
VTVKGLVPESSISSPGASLPQATDGPPHPLLEIRNLRTQVATADGLVDVVDGIDLSIGRGEVLALVGESGSGKTMTALSIMRLLPPQAQISSGAILLDGLDLLALSESQMNGIRGARIGLLFQQPIAALDPTSRIGTQVAEAPRLHRGQNRHQAWERAVSLLTDVGIPEPRQRARSYVNQMSGGMAQRVMIAAALSGEPALLIADEPTTSVDVTVQAQILRLLATKRAEINLAMLLITHDLCIVAAVADRVAVMYSGCIVEVATVEQIFQAPQHPYTQALIQSSLLLPDEHGRLFAIPGVMSTRPPASAGCRFCSRCAVADTLSIRVQCEAEEPPLVALPDKEHASRCWGTKAALQER